jgi:hypothetical protein
MDPFKAEDSMLPGEFTAKKIFSPPDSQVTQVLKTTSNHSGKRRGWWLEFCQRRVIL